MNTKRKDYKFTLFSIIQAIAYLFSAVMAFLSSYYRLEKLYISISFSGIVEFIGFMLIGIVLFIFSLRNIVSVVKLKTSKE